MVGQGFRGSVGRGQVTEGGVGQGWDCGLYSECDGSVGGGHWNWGMMQAYLCFRSIWLLYAGQEWKRKTVGWLLLYFC